MTTWHITLDRQENRRKAAFLEGQARLAANAPDAAAEFSLTLYSDQISLNVPADTTGRLFIDRLIQLLGPPRMEPTVKCSCSWGDGVMGAMVMVLWDLPRPESAATLQDLDAFLGAR